LKFFFAITTHSLKYNYILFYIIFNKKIIDAINDKL